MARIIKASMSHNTTNYEIESNRAHVFHQADQVPGDNQINVAAHMGAAMVTDESRIIEELSKENSELKHTINLLKAKIDETNTDYDKRFQQLKTEAYEKGIEEAEQLKQSAVYEELQRLTQLVNKISEEYGKAFTAESDDIVEIIHSALLKIVATKYSKIEIHNVVRDSIKKHITSKKVTVYLAEHDLGYFNDFTIEGHELRLMSDSKVKSGGCIVESEYERLDCRLDSKLEIFKNLLLEAHYDAG